ncbi:hypothetical protein HYV87_05190 [Candidatus Woesearchaeota archaeon]|nr:hypothetical protein [Candidatus Woesearchaeota archaeon]
MTHYLAFGTVYRNPQSGGKTAIDHPFECYRYNGPPSQIDMAILQDGGLKFVPLDRLDNRYKKVIKWVKQRNILNSPRASCLASKEDITEILCEEQEELNQR